MSAYEGSRMQEEDERRKKFTSEKQLKDEEKISLGELLLNAGYKIVEQDKELTRLRSELQQERELRKELVECIESYIDLELFANPKPIESLIAKSKAK